LQGGLIEKRGCSGKSTRKGVESFPRKLDHSEQKRRTKVNRDSSYLGPSWGWQGPERSLMPKTRGSTVEMHSSGNGGQRGFRGGRARPDRHNTGVGGPGGRPRRGRRDRKKKHSDQTHVGGEETTVGTRGHFGGGVIRKTILRPNCSRNHRGRECWGLAKGRHEQFGKAWTRDCRFYRKENPEEASTQQGRGNPMGETRTGG